MRSRAILLFCLACGAMEAQNNLTTTAIQRYFNGVRRNLEGAADAMPAEKYGFRLTEGQMTFAEWLNHSSDRNYTDCATLKGEPVPDAGKAPITFTAKAAVSQALRDSLAYCAKALEGVDDQKVIATPQMSYSFLHVIVHNNEIYGNLAGYLRANGIVPPSTAARIRQQNDKKK
ncbi:MAG TPA: DinB family protein [Bryobacteraceae bacterium]|nr:DinB family protein [Bryobacteraceae bacterium]